MGLKWEKAARNIIYSEFLKKIKTFQHNYVQTLQKYVSKGQVWEKLKLAKTD